MIDFVNAPPFLRIALWVAMETAFSQISRSRFIFGEHFFRIKGGPREQFGTHEKLSLGCKVG